MGRGSNFNCFNFIFVVVATKSFVNTNKMATKGVESQKCMNQLEMLTLKDMNRFALFLALRQYIHQLTVHYKWILDIVFTRC